MKYISSNQLECFVDVVTDVDDGVNSRTEVVEDVVGTITHQSDDDRDVPSNDLEQRPEMISCAQDTTSDRSDDECPRLKKSFSGQQCYYGRPA